jgi:hypothetical protein
MNFRKPFFPAGFVLGAMLLTMLTGCIGYVDGPPRAGVQVDAFAVQDDYVYYPDYECYYSVSRHQYAYREGNVWVARPAPRGVSAARLRTSPSVKMDFHDSPANHHAVVARQYPKNWTPPRANPPVQKENRNNDSHDERGDNHGK